MLQQENDTSFLPQPIPIPTLTTVQPWWRGSSFPYSQYKELMPEDQFEKLLAMHENSAANAAMYVAIVLAVYIVLLSLLLCRYVRRRPPPPRELLVPLPFSSLHTTTATTTISPGEGISGGVRGRGHGPRFWDRMMSFVTKPYDALRHCTLRSGAGVGSISSEENDEERCSTILRDGHGHSHHRRDSSIRMNQIQLHPMQTASNSTIMDRKGSSVTVNISMDQDDGVGTATGQDNGVGG